MTQLDLANALIKLINDLHPKVVEQREQIISSRIYLDKNKTVITESKFNKRFRVWFPEDDHMRLPTFNLNEFWLLTLYEYYQEQYEQLKEIELLYKSIIEGIQNLSKIFNDPLPEYSKEVIAKGPPACSDCKRIMFECRKHRRAPEHKKHYYNKLADQFTADTVIAIDTEFCQSDEKCTATQKFWPIPYRVAAYSFVKSRKRAIPTIIYHSFWDPGEKFRIYTPVTGLTKSDISRAQRENLFIPADEGRKFLKEVVIQDRSLVFAGAKQDLKALNLELSNKVYDTQDFFNRNPLNRNKQPVKLSWLVKNILFDNIQEFNEISSIHNPAVDAKYTLILYSKIPKEFWTLNEQENYSPPLLINSYDKLISIFEDKFEFRELMLELLFHKNKTESNNEIDSTPNNNHTIEIFQENFEPNYEPDFDPWANEMETEQN